MALKIPKIGLPQMLKDGYKASERTRLTSSTFKAWMKLSIVISMQPKNLQRLLALHWVPKVKIIQVYLMVGRNKMVINHLEKLFVTNDAATIMKELDVMHPAAKLLVLGAQQQEAEAS
jgi:T-complex protein 1 subunit theta